MGESICRSLTSWLYVVAVVVVLVVGSANKQSELVDLVCGCRSCCGCRRLVAS